MFFSMMLRCVLYYAICGSTCARACSKKILPSEHWTFPSIYNPRCPHNRQRETVGSSLILKCLLCDAVVVACFVVAVALAARVFSLPLLTASSIKVKGLWSTLPPSKSFTRYVNWKWHAFLYRSCRFLSFFSQILFCLFPLSLIFFLSLSPPCLLLYSTYLLSCTHFERDTDSWLCGSSRWNSKKCFSKVMLLEDRLEN